MEPLVMALGALVALAALALAVLATRGKGDRERLAALDAAAAAARAELDAARAAAAQGLAAQTAAETRLAEAQRHAVLLAVERDESRAAREAALAAQGECERALAVMRQRLVEGELRIADFERLKDESLKAAQAAVLNTAQQLSSKLLEDHKRENAEAKKQGEELVRQTTEQLLRQFEQITNSVAQLQGQVGEKSQVLDTVWRALTSPAGSGYFAEIGLANTLKSFGLAEGRDYLLQHTTEDAETGRRLRPDAVVFLPGDSLLVIDCKASKFLLEIARAEGGAEEDAAYHNLARSMNQHLKALAEKDYRNAVAADCRAAGRNGAIARILSVMYLPNEGALEKLHRADPDFVVKAAQHQIIPAGPAGLAGFIGFASVEISLVRQIENQKEIVRGTELLLDRLAVALGYAAAIGKGIKSAADAYERFSRSVNGRLMKDSRHLAELGLRPNKPPPANLPAFHIQMLEPVIEGEAEEVADATDKIAILVERAGD